MVFLDKKVKNIELTKLDEVHGFFQCVEFVPFEKDSSIHCMCDGGPLVEVYAEDKKIGTFTLHHGESIRWDAYDTDLRLTKASSAKLTTFLKKHKITNP